MCSWLLKNQSKRTAAPQPFSAYVGGVDGDGWRTARPLSRTPGPVEAAAQQQDPNASADPGMQIQGLLRSVDVLSWNIDFSIPEEVPRMQTALAHLHSVVQQIPESSAVVIFLQEMTGHKLRVIRQTPWVRERFYMTDESSGFWMSSYGTTILVDRRLVISGDGVRRLRLVSEFGRDGLFVDLLVRSARDGPGAAPDDRQHDKILRLCNVHLESLASNPPRRPAQFAALSPLLQPSATVHASIMAGDTNANRPYDATLPAENNLTDTYLFLGGAQDAEDGNTWGYQSGRTRFPPSRLDKMLYAGGLEAVKLDRLGIGIVVEDVAARTRLENIGEEEYVTDHYGLWGRFGISDGLGLVSAKEAWRQCCEPNACACANPSDSEDE